MVGSVGPEIKFPDVSLARHRRVQKLLTNQMDEALARRGSSATDLGCFPDISRLFFPFFPFQLAVSICPKARWVGACCWVSTRWVGLPSK